MFRIKHKEFNKYLGFPKRGKRGILVPKGEEYITNDMKKISKFYENSNKGSMKNKLVVEIINE